MEISFASSSSIGSRAGRWRVSAGAPAAGACVRGVAPFDEVCGKDRWANDHLRPTPQCMVAAPARQGAVTDSPERGHGSRPCGRRPQDHREARGRRQDRRRMRQVSLRPCRRTRHGVCRCAAPHGATQLLFVLLSPGRVTRADARGLSATGSASDRESLLRCCRIQSGSPCHPRRRGRSPGRR
jgi:hypothetical protein